MKIAVIGATGFVGKNIVHELTERGHQVLAISRNGGNSTNDNLTYIAKDVLDTNGLSEALKGCDVVVSAYNSGWENPNIYDDFIKGAASIEQAVKLAGVKRFIVIGGAGSLYLPNGVQVIDTPEFPAAFKAGATAARDYLNLLKDEKELDWAFFSPAMEMHHGITTGRTGKYRLGKDNPVLDEAGRSVHSAEDVAVVIADEVEAPKHHRERFTAAY